MMTSAMANSDEGWLYRVGGISAFVLGLAYLAIFPLYARVGAPPAGDGAAWLQYLAGKTDVWWTILGLSVLTDFLFVPVALALYFALERIHRPAMLLATALVGLFVVLDLAVTWTGYASLLSLSARHAAATNDVERAAYVAAAHAASAMVTSRLEVVYAIVTLSSAILVTGLVMRKGPLGRATSWLGVVTGVLGIVCLAGLGVTIILNAVCATAWLFFVGAHLLRLGGPEDHRFGDPALRAR
jgi:hypothetical protein